MTPPIWGVLLEMADGDPLRAMELEEKLTETWFHRWTAWRKEKNAVKPD